MAMSDRIAIFDQGKILQCGSPRELFEEPTTAFVAEFLGDSNLVGGHLARRGEGLVFLGQDVEYRVEAGRCEELGLRPEDPAAVALRPERVTVEIDAGPDSGGAGHGLHVAGLVKEVTYLGTSVRCLVGASFGDLVIQLPARTDDGIPGPGDRVGLTWAAQHCVLVRR